MIYQPFYIDPRRSFIFPPIFQIIISETFSKLFLHKISHSLLERGQFNFPRKIVFFFFKKLFQLEIGYLCLGKKKEFQYWK